MIEFCRCMHLLNPFILLLYEDDFLGLFLSSGVFFIGRDLVELLGPGSTTVYGLLKWNWEVEICTTDMSSTMELAIQWYLEVYYIPCFCGLFFISLVPRGYLGAAFRGEATMVGVPWNETRDPGELDLCRLRSWLMPKYASSFFYESNPSGLISHDLVDICSVDCSRLKLTSSQQLVFVNMLAQGNPPINHQDLPWKSVKFTEIQYVCRKGALFLWISLEMSKRRRTMAAKRPKRSSLTEAAVSGGSLGGKWWGSWWVPARKSPLNQGFM